MSRPDIIAVDFDGTLCTNVHPFIGDPNQELINVLIGLREKGAKLILWTCRAGSVLAQAVEWCKSFGLEFDAVNENLPGIVQAFGHDSRKIYADLYIDDRAAEPNPGLKELREKQNA